MNWFKKFLIKFASLIYPSKLYGLENIPEGATLFTYNHLSALDPFFILKAYPKDINFLAKIELFDNKLSGKILKSFGAIPIDRDNPDVKTLFTVFKKLRNGQKITISPEGTRNKTGSIDFLPFKPGTALFGLKGKCKIVPVIVEKKAKIFRRTNVMFGKPYDLSEFYDMEFNEDLTKIINEKIKSEMLKTQQELFALVKKA